MSKFTQAILVVVALIVGVTALDAFFQSQNFYTVGIRNKLDLLGATSFIDASEAGSYIKGNAAFAKVDSFTTTALKDTIVMTGADIGDAVFVSQWNPTWSATPDSNYTYSGYVLNSDTVVVQRETTGYGVPNAKSGAHFAAFRVEL